jgi:hypothetical protein
MEWPYSQGQSRPFRRDRELGGFRSVVIVTEDLQRVVVAIDYSRCSARGVSQTGRVSDAFGYTSSRLIVQNAFPARFTTTEIVGSERSYIGWVSS